MGLFGKERDLNRPPEEVLLEVDGSFFQTRKDELEVRLAMDSCPIHESKSEPESPKSTNPKSKIQSSSRH